MFAVPLLIDFKAGDKLIINGSVLENAGPSSKLLVHNQSAILREKEVMSAADTTTPAARVYFALQCAYIFPAKRDEYLNGFQTYLTDYVEACPSAKPIADAIRREVDKGELYRGLKTAQKLLAHEADVLKAFQNGLQATVGADGADSGER